MSELQEQLAETPDSDAAGSTAAEDHTEASGQHDYDHDDADSQEQTAEEEEEIEVGDRKLALPKSVAAQLKTERMLNADYTQKTQAVAAERAEIQRQAKVQHEVVREMAALHSIDERITAYNAAITSQLSQEDPGLCQRYMVERDELYNARNQAANSLTQKEQQIALNKQQEFAKQVQQADAYMKREIPGFTPARSDELQKYGIKHGMTGDAITKAVIKNPVVAVLMHKAELYDKLLAKQAPKPPPVATAKPAIRVGSNASVQKDPAKMTDKEFASWRASQIKNRK